MHTISFVITAINTYITGCYLWLNKLHTWCWWRRWSNYISHAIGGVESDQKERSSSFFFQGGGGFLVFINEGSCCKCAL